MKRTTLPLLVRALEEERHEVVVPPDVMAGARRALERMLELSGGASGREAGGGGGAQAGGRGCRA
jgi:hypothetical protein